MKLHRWRDIRAKKFTPERLERLEAEAREYLLGAATAFDIAASIDATDVPAFPPRAPSVAAALAGDLAKVGGDLRRVLERDLGADPEE